MLVGTVVGEGTRGVVLAPSSDGRDVTRVLASPGPNTSRTRWSQSVNKA